MWMQEEFRKINQSDETDEIKHGRIRKGVGFIIKIKWIKIKCDKSASCRVKEIIYWLSLWAKIVGGALIKKCKKE